MDDYEDVIAALSVLGYFGIVANIVLLIVVAVRPPPALRATAMTLSGLAILMFNRLTAAWIVERIPFGSYWALLVSHLTSAAFSWAGIGLLVLAAYQTGRREVDPAPPFST